MIRFISLLVLIISFNCFSKNVSYSNIEKESMKKWIIKECKVTNLSSLNKIVNSIYKYSYKRNLDPHLVAGIIKKESCFRPNAKSNVGAIGLMQVMEKFHLEKIATLTNKSLLDIDSNIAVGTKILEEYLKQKNNDLKKALVKYSGNARSYYKIVVANKYSLKDYINNSLKTTLALNEKFY